MYHFVLPEPLSKLLRNAKQNAANTDVEKVSDTRRLRLIFRVTNTHAQNVFPLQRTSLGASLLSPVSQLALGTIGRSRSLINQSQESLDPCDHYNHSDREEEPHQQDADDEDDSGMVSVPSPMRVQCLLSPSKRANAEQSETREAERGY